MDSDFSLFAISVFCFMAFVFCDFSLMFLVYLYLLTMGFLSCNVTFFSQKYLLFLEFVTSKWWMFYWMKERFHAVTDWGEEKEEEDLFGKDVTEGCSGLATLGQSNPNGLSRAFKVCMCLIWILIGNETIQCLRCYCGWFMLAKLNVYIFVNVCGSLLSFVFICISLWVCWVRRTKSSRFKSSLLLYPLFLFLGLELQVDLE